MVVQKIQEYFNEIFKNKNITKIRSGTILKFYITEKDENAAKDEILKICDDLRIYNPLVSKVTATTEKI